MKQSKNIIEQPWYRQFWPWFLITLPTIAVIASITTLWIAMQQDTGLMSDNYYKDGVNINNELARQSLAHTANITARLQFIAQDKKVLLYIQGDIEFPKQLKLELSAPLNSEKDQLITLKYSSQSLYKAQLDNIDPGYYYLKLYPATNSWVIKQKIDIQANNIIVLSAIQ